jgi:ABC-type transporter Mla subunit MlaD
LIRGGFGRPEWGESYAIAAERRLSLIAPLGSEQPVTDTVRTLNPAVLDRINEVRKGLERASAELDALLESIAPTDTEVKRQVTLHLREVGEEIQSALDQLEAAESSASGTIEPNDQG